MSRPIKFRAWDPDHKAMHYSEDSSLDWLFGLVQRHDATIMQFTGLLDKNGKEIWEGDILLCGDVNEEHEDFKTEVWFGDGKFLTRHYGFPVSSWAKDSTRDNSWCEVIGNIYENGDLLK